MIGLVAYVGHALAALLFGILTVGEVRAARRERHRWEVEAVLQPSKILQQVSNLFRYRLAI